MLEQPIPLLCAVCLRSRKRELAVKVYENGFSLCQMHVDLADEETAELEALLKESGPED